MSDRAQVGWLRVAQSNVRYWGRQTGRPDFATRVRRILRHAQAGHYNSIEDLKAFLQPQIAREVGSQAAANILKAATDNYEAKRNTIRAYFRDWNRDIERARNLLDQQQHYLDAWLVFSCYIGALAVLRYPFPHERFDRPKYLYAVLKYSGHRSIYENVDLLFFLQWSRSQYAKDGRYKKVRTHYQKLKATVETYLGTENEVQADAGRRYVPARRLVELWRRQCKGLTSKDLKEIVALFTVAELLYRHVRNHAVHERRFPLVTSIYSGGSVRYVDNHVINGRLLYETASKMLHGIKAECLESVKFPHELRQKRKWR